MNSQESDLLNQLLKQLGEVKLTAKDAEAEALIREATALQPDAAYLLVQRALLLEHALNTAKARNDELQAQLQNNQSGQRGGFLGNDPWAQQTSQASQATVSGNRQTPQPAPQQQPGGSLFGGGSSFLGTVATTAAGVMAGSFLFQGIENLMGHHASSFGQQAFNDPVTEPTVTNNYYGDDARQQASNDEDNSNDFLASNDTDSFQDDSGDSDWA